MKPLRHAQRLAIATLPFIVAIGLAPLAVFAGGCASAPPPAPTELSADPPLDGANAGRAESELQRAVAFIKNEKWAEAKAHIDVALADRPDDADANYYLGVVSEGLQDTAAAEAAYRKAIAKDPSLVEAATNLAAIYLEAASPRADEAIVLLQGALAKKSDDPALLRNLAYALGLKGDVDEASKAYDRLLAKGEDAQVRFAYGSMLADHKQVERAAEQLKKALAAPDLEAPVLASIGMMLGYSKSFTECIGAYDRALKLKPGEAEWLTRRGTCRHGVLDEAGAKADFTAAIKADPTYAAGHFYLGQALLAERKRGSAFDSFTKAAELDKDGPIGKASRDKLATLTDVSQARNKKR